MDDHTVQTRPQPGAIIYTHSMLEGSMTFIKSHAEALTLFEPIYVGSHRVHGLPLPEDRTYTVNEGSFPGLIREAMFRKFRYAPRLIKKLRHHDPRVIHAHFGDCGPAAMTIADRLDIPLVVTFHGQDATLSPSQARKTLRGRELLKRKSQMIDKAGVFIAVSNHIRKCLLERGYPDDKVIVHRNGIDLDFFSPQPDQPREPVILFVGRFVEKKGAQYLIDAARILRNSGVDFELVMIGSGPLDAELRKLADKHNVPCRFEGFLEVSEVKSRMARASVVAVPSVTASDGDSEGLPTVLLEAQAMATPIVATRHSGIPDGVRQGRTAELVDERDSEMLAQQLGTFLRSPDKVRRFGEAGRQFVEENFDIRAQARGLEKIYVDLMGRNAPV